MIEVYEYLHGLSPGIVNTKTKCLQPEKYPHT